MFILLTVLVCNQTHFPVLEQLNEWRVFFGSRIFKNVLMNLNGTFFEIHEEWYAISTTSLYKTELAMSWLLECQQPSEPVMGTIGISGL